jgi:alkyl hydroperoxide reductase subunit AhpC
MTPHLGDIAPNFVYQSTVGEIDFHACLGTNWGPLFSHPNATLTVRPVFFVDPKNKISATITHPASARRNFNQILCVIDSLQLTEADSVAPPASWNVGDDVIIVPSLQDTGSVEENILEEIHAHRALPAHHAAASNEACQ